MDERYRKCRRLYLRSGIPHSKLVTLLGDLKKEPDLDRALTVSRKSLHRSWEVLYEQVGKVVDIKLPDSSVQWPILSFKKALEHLVQVSDTFKMLLRQAWQRKPCTRAQPWSLILYGDEVVPGNVLRPDNHRKVFGWYCTIKEFGPTVTKHEIAWIPIGVLRSCLVKHSKGGISVATKELVRSTFLDDALSTEGVCLNLDVEGGSFATLYFKLGNLVADADGHRAMWSCKGASGKLMCPCCTNVVDDTMHEESARLVHMSCPDPTRFLLASNDDWWAKADMLEARKPTSLVGEFQTLQLAVGFTYVEGGLVWDRELRTILCPTETFTFDSMHCYLSNGVANWEVDAMLGRLKAQGITLLDVQSYLQAEWKLCKVNGRKSQILGCFTPSRQKSFQDGGCLRAGASEMLLLYPILALFVATVVQKAGKLPKEAASFEALALVMELLRRGKEGYPVSSELADAIANHSRLFALAYPDIDQKPKAHYAHHIAKQLRRDGWIIDAFVGERKHRPIKAMGSDITNTRTYEKTVLFSAFARQSADLEVCELFRDRLLRPRSAPDLLDCLGVSSAHVSNSMTWMGSEIWAGDLVVVNDSILVVACCLAADDDLVLVGDPYKKVAQVFLQYAGRHRYDRVDVVLAQTHSLA